MPLARENDLVLLIAQDGKKLVVRLTPAERLHTHKGIIEHDCIIDEPLGRVVQSHLDLPFVVVKPSIHDLIMNAKRASAIVYPKEIGYLMLKMNIGAGCRVIEAGTGSGALTTALAFSVCPSGHVYSYDSREDMINLARKNLQRLGLEDYVSFTCSDIGSGFGERDVDALFLDVRKPSDYLPQAKEALQPGGFFGSLVPTTNQVSDLLGALQDGGFADIEVCEIMLREYKTVPARLRPVDRMVAHTGYLIFARPISREDTRDRQEPGARVAGSVG